MNDKTINFYNRKANEFQTQYLSTTTEAVHEAWLSEYLPKSGVLLDVGAGVGRDAKYFAQQGLDVVAVEAAKELLKLGADYTESLPVLWLEDILPELVNTIALELKFDVILLSAVWMHIPLSKRERAFRKIANLLKPNGVLVITLRHGKSGDERDMYPVSIDELNKLAQQQGLVTEWVKSDDDCLNRPDVYWETVVMRLPDDGTGAFPTLRTILINDAKSSTYKLALMRTLVRIADGHPGAVLRREDNRVILPMGLIALYWARQYKPLLQAGIQQNANASKGLGFVTPEGWQNMAHISASDLTVGQLFTNDAQALHITLKAISKTIRDMPVKFITQPGTQKPLFEACIPLTPNKVEFLFTDIKTLHQYGEFSIPQKIWQNLSHYGCWIEPVILNEWVNVMMGYKLNQGIVTKSELFTLLQWMDATRKTTLVRKKVDELMKVHSLNCVWSHKALKSTSYAVDHSLPFSRWPNNDLWNLLPALKAVNANKSDKVPSRAQLYQSKEAIINWWHQGWMGEDITKQSFFSQAQITLPGLDWKGESLDDVYSAMTLQSVRLVEQQQLPRWQYC